MKTIFLTGAGFVFLGLGAIGVFLPLWPTTPFVLVAAACFSCAPRIRAKIMKITFFREHIENYENRKGLSAKTFVISMVWLWGMLLLSMVMVRTIWVVGLLVLIGAAVTCHLLFMFRPQKRKRSINETDG